MVVQNWACARAGNPPLTLAAKITGLRYTYGKPTQNACPALPVLPPLSNPMKGLGRWHGAGKDLRHTYVSKPEM
jgi:hypothetical protein